jgi:hypothetical protein
VRARSARLAIARAAHPALVPAQLDRVRAALAREFAIAPIALAGDWIHQFTLPVSQSD